MRALGRLARRGGRPLPRGVPVILLLVIAVVLVNAVRFPDDDRAVHHTAITRADTGDIVELSLGLSNVETTHNVFARLGQIAPGAVVFVTDDGDFRPASNVRARLLGLGLVEDVEVVPPDSVPPHEGLELGGHLVAEGEVWNWPGDARADQPGATWAIFADAGTPEAWLFVSRDDADPRWLFIDTRLLAVPVGQDGRR